MVAQWIALCRSTVRKGALFFVRDPRDPDAHPIKEMTEQSVKVQFTKLSKSVLLYAALMLVFFTATRFLQVVHPRFLPLRWFASQSFSALPLDLVFALAILPSTVNMLRPVRTIRIIFGDWTKVVAHHLRLSSFLLGNRDMSEEGSFAWRSWKDAFTLGMLRSGDDSDSARVWTASGSLARAPGVDHIKLIPDRPATIAVDAEGHALNKEGEEGIELQRAHGLSDEDFATVYIPPHFRPRLMLAMYLLWAAAALFAITSMVLPCKLCPI